MPTIITRGAASAKAFGFGASSAGPTYAYKWIFCSASTSSKTFVLPSCVTSVYLEAIGPGGQTLGTGTGGGGGGSYAGSLITIASGATITYKPGTASTCSWASKSGGSPGTSSCGVLAIGGSPNSGYTGGNGGLAVSSIGQVKYSGGKGGNGLAAAVAGGGGGAAGPNGNGGDGGTSPNSVSGSGGGGAANGGTSGSNGTACYGGFGGYTGSNAAAQGAGASQASSIGINGGGGGGGYQSYGGPKGGSNYCYFGAGLGPGGGAGGGGNYSSTDYYAFGGGAGGVKSSGNISQGGAPLVAASFNMTSSPNGYLLSSGSSSDGRLQFVKIAGVDTSDNIYYTASAPYDTQNSIYVVKQNKNGTIVWSRKLIPPGGRSVYKPTAIMDSSNNIYIAFSYSYLGTYTLEFVKYNSSGVIQVQTQATQSYSGIPYWSMAQDSNGDIWVVGTTQDDYRLYTYKFSSAGTLLNTRYFTNFMGFSNVASAGIYAGEAGYMYYDYIPYNFYNCCCTLVYNYYNAILKVDTSYNWQWGKYGFPNSFFPQRLGVGVDSSNYVYYGRYAQSSYSPQIYKISSSGSIQWGRIWQQNAYTANVTYTNNTLKVNSNGDSYFSYFPTCSGGGELTLVSLTSSGVFQNTQKLTSYIQGQFLGFSSGNYSTYLTNNGYYFISNGINYLPTIYQVAAIPLATSTSGLLPNGNYGPLNLASSPGYSTNDTSQLVTYASGPTFTNGGETASSGVFTDASVSLTGFVGPF